MQGPIQGGHPVRVRHVSGGGAGSHTLLVGRFSSESACGGSTSLFLAVFSSAYSGRRGSPYFYGVGTGLCGAYRFIVPLSPAPVYIPYNEPPRPPLAGVDDMSR